MQCVVSSHSIAIASIAQWLYGQRATVPNKKCARVARSGHMIKNQFASAFLIGRDSQ